MALSPVITVSTVTVPPLGTIKLAASEAGICALALPRFDDHGLNLEPWMQHGFQIKSGTHPFLKQAGDELLRYAQQRLQLFRVPLDLRYLPPFTSRVLNVLRNVPFGSCLTYGTLASQAGNPLAARAVGGAVGRNPIPIIIPCHRIVASTGIGGFGLGLRCKRILLSLEGVMAYSDKK
jgi:methylated-DNA-[protein]-cysteine S-methyltransferase